MPLTNSFLSNDATRLNACDVIDVILANVHKASFFVSLFLDNKGDVE